MSKTRVPNFTVEGTRIVYRNFRGEGTQFNDRGKRNFGLILSDEDAEALERDGWNVKYMKPKPDDPDEYRQPWLPVKVKFDPYPPIIQLISSRGKIRLTEDTVEQLDWCRIANVDAVIRPYEYPASNVAPAGIAAYLKAIYVTVEEDPLEEKYANIPDIV